MNADHFNAFFEGVGFLFTLLNIRRLLRDRKVEGVDWRVTAFWSLWGVWNVFYYPHLGQWFSACAGVLICLSNITWVCLAIWYTRQTKKALK